VQAAFSITYNTLTCGYFDKDDKNNYENIYCLKYICEAVFVSPSSFLFGLWVIFIFYHVIILCGIIVVSVYGIVYPSFFIFMREVLYSEGHKTDQ